MRFKYVLRSVENYTTAEKRIEWLVSATEWDETFYDKYDWPGPHAFKPKQYIEHVLRKYNESQIRT